MVFVNVHTPRPTSKGLDHPYLHVYACSLLRFMLVLTTFVQGFSTLDALSGFVVVRLHSTPMRPCLDVTIWDASPWCRLPRAHLFPFPLLCDDILTMLICATLWLSMHLYTLAYMSMHESCLLVCHLFFNTMKLWTPNPNLHLSLADTTFCLLAFLFAFLLVDLLSCLFALSLVCSYPCFSARHAYRAYLLYAFSYALFISSFHCLSTGFLSLPLHVHTWSEDVWS